MTVLLKNNVASTITSTINASDVGITVASGTGALFPTITGGDYFYATLTSTGGTQEIVKVSARVSDTMTIARAQDNTTAQSFSSGSRIEMRVNVAAIEDYTLTAAGAVFPENFSWYSVKDFGAAGDGVTNDSDAINAGLTYVKANGGTLWFPDGTYICKGIQLDGNAKYYSMIGGGKERVTFQHVDGDGTLFNDSGPSQIGYNIQGFTANLKNSVFLHPNANHGFAIRQRSNVSIRDVDVKDFASSAMLIYDPDATGLYGRNSITDCSCDGFNLGTNGFLFSNMDYCSYLRVHAKNVTNPTDDGPGMAVQFKNNCRWGSATDVIGENSVSGFALAGDNDGLVPGPSFITATNLRLINCANPLRLGNQTNHCTITNAYINQTVASVTDAIRITDYSYGNTISNVVIERVAPTSRAVFFRNGAHDNNVHISILDTALNGAPVVVFGTAEVGPPAYVACEYNNVRLSRALNPRLRTSFGISRMATFDGAADNNSFTYDNYPYWDNYTIASGVIGLENAIIEQYVIVDTEGSAATDDLDTITNYYQQEGQRIIVRTNNGSRDVTVRHLIGNISLAGGVNFTLALNRSMLQLIWNTDLSRWEEAFRVTNV
jgi:hypothetical protein